MAYAIQSELMIQRLDRRIHSLNQKCKIPLSNITNCTKSVFYNTFFFSWKFLQTIFDCIALCNTQLSPIVTKLLKKELRFGQTVKMKMNQNNLLPYSLTPSQYYL